MRIFLIILYLASSAFALDWQRDVQTGDFTSESHPGDDDNVRKDSQTVTYIQNGNWIAYQNFDFGAGVEYLWIEGASPNAGGTVEFRLGSPSGTLMGSVSIADTGDWNTYKPLGLKIQQPVSGVQDLYLTCVGGEGYLFNLGKFRFQRLAPDYHPPGGPVDWEKPVLSQEMNSAGAFGSESHPADSGIIRSDNGKISYIQPESWVGYQGYDFGAGANFFSILGATPADGGTVEVRIGSPTGDLIGSVSVTNTGAYDVFKPFTANLTHTVAGIHDLYFKFLGSGWSLFDLASFRFQNLAPEAKSPGRLVAANLFDQESHPGTAPVLSDSVGISALAGGSWVSYANFDFKQETDLITIDAATPNKGGKVEVRLGSENGPLVATLDVTFTGSWTHFRPYTAAFSQKISGIHDLYLKFVDSHGTGGDLFNVRNLVVGRKTPVAAAPAVEGALHIYPPVPGLAASPYYTFSVQKVSALNASLKEDATNWESPFAWFTECVEPVAGVTTAYFEEFIGGWSHTYANFEMDRNTPIVVKITRNTITGAPSGPIFMANVHPAHKVESCEVINGEVYVTMREPALITIDIDGQLDTRDAPRAIPDVWSGAFAPYASKQNGAHAVSIFANPFLNDKPTPTGPGVRAIEPGDPLPAAGDDSWTTLYFKPGIHNLSQDGNGVARPWQPTDPVILQSGKNYYIPGDAIVYGNFDGRSDPTYKKDIRFFGHGTLSGMRIPHWLDYQAPEGTSINVRMINISGGGNCHIEGITIADPAEHGVYVENWNGVHHMPQNSMRWIKSISWRVNNDTGSTGGLMEDCFFRHQDDGIYVGGSDVRRCVFWSDVNGVPFHCPHMARDLVPETITMFPREIVIEDCDVIYARGMFGFGNSKEFGIIANHYLLPNRSYSDGTLNTSQHLIFRNIRVTDPRPVRNLFGLQVPAADTDFLGWAGMRFEKIEYRHPQTWGWKNHLIGGSNGPIRHCYFDAVSINGKAMDETLLADPSVIVIQNVSNLAFGGVTNPTQTTIDTTGGTTVLDFDAPQNTYIGNGTLRVSTDGSIERQIFLGNGGGDTPTIFAMTGGLITIDSGVSLVNGGWAKGVWTDNRADMLVNGILDLWDGQAVQVNALNGTGSVVFGYPWGGDSRQLVVGVDGGSGNFSGSIAGPHPNAGTFIHILKNGTGTQTLGNLANQKPQTISINEGEVNLSNATDVTFAANISGPGTLTKSGSGQLALTGILTHTGNTIIEDGNLIVPQPAFADSSTVTIGMAAGSSAVLHLPSSGTDRIAELIIDGVSQPGGGWVYDSSNSGGAITGNGKIQVGIAPSGYAAWGFTHSVTGGPHDDDDKDGLTNFEEYAFGLLPKNSSSVNPISVPLSAESGNFSYTRRHSALSEPMTYSVWYSTGLQTGSWIKDAGATEGTPIPDGDVETVPVTLSLALLENPRLFIQVRAE